MFGYILRTILQRIVLKAVKIHNDGELKIMTKAISMKSYKEAACNVRNDILKSTGLWYDEIQAFHTYNIEQDENLDLAKIKLKWDNLDVIVKSDFISRVKAEADFKEQLKNFNTRNKEK